MIGQPHRDTSCPGCSEFLCALARSMGLDRVAALFDCTMGSDVDGHFCGNQRDVSMLAANHSEQTIVE